MNAKSWKKERRTRQLYEEATVHWLLRGDKKVREYCCGAWFHADKDGRDTGDWSTVQQVRT